MITLKTSEAKTLNFDIDVEGSKNKPEVKYIIESEPFSYCFNGIIEDKKIKIKIPKLCDTITSGQYESKIEIVLDENLFCPWSGSIMIETPIEVKIKESVEENLVEKKVAVKLSNKETIEEKIEEVKIMEEIEVKGVFEKKSTENLMDAILED